MADVETVGSISEGEHARAVFPATCLGEKCPNYQGTDCTDSYFEWRDARATVTEDRDFSKPPLVNEATFVTYGQVCLRGAQEKDVRYRIDDYGNGHYYQEQTGLLMHGDSRFGAGGPDIELFDVKKAEDGTISEELRATYEGWG